MSVNKLGGSDCGFDLHLRNNVGDDLNFPGCLWVASCVSGHFSIFGAIDGYVFAQS